MDTLKLRSLPSPGMVTSSSTYVVDDTQMDRWLNTFLHRCNVHAISVNVEILSRS